MEEFIECAQQSLRKQISSAAVYLGTVTVISFLLWDSGLQTTFFFFFSSKCRVVVSFEVKF